MAAVRTTISFTAETESALREYMDRHGVTLPEAVRRAVKLQRYIEGATDRRAKILIQEPGEEPREVIFVS